MSAPATLAAARASTQTIPFKRDAAGADTPLAGGAVGVLVISLIAIGAVLYVRKRMNFNSAGGSKTGLLKVLETERLGPRGLLSVVEFSGTHYLLAQGEHGITCLASAPAKGSN